MKKHTWLTKLFILGIFMSCLFVIQAFFVLPVIVKGDSMAPTLVNRQRVFVWKQGSVERFDIIIFPSPEDPEQKYVKRIIGLPGDSIEFQEDQLYINGQSYSEPYIEQFKAELLDGREFTKDFVIDTIPEGQYFVLGDNRRISKDSRSIGLIREADIQGKASLVFWPLNKIKLVGND